MTRRRALVGLAGLVAMATIGGAVLFVARPASSGHFDNGEFSFDYPTGWRTIAVPAPTQGPPNPSRLEVVLGTGDWTVTCDNPGYCRPDKVDVSGGRVVVKVTRRVDGPGVACDYVPPGTPLAARSEESGHVSWEIRQPGVPDGYMGNVYLDVWMDGTSAETQVDALVASFRWGPQASLPPACIAGVPVPTVGPTQHYDDHGVSFDFPADWSIEDRYEVTDGGWTVDFAVGTGTFGNGCVDVLMGQAPQCGEPTVQLADDQIVVYMVEGPGSARQSLASTASAPPGQTTTTVGGRPAHEETGYHWARWWLTDATCLAAYWGPTAADEQPEIQALVDSLKLPY